MERINIILVLRNCLIKKSDIKLYVCGMYVHAYICAYIKILKADVNTLRILQQSLDIFSHLKSIAFRST